MEFALSDLLIRALLPDPGLRLSLVDARHTVAQAMVRHQLRAGAAVPLGRALMGAVLLLHQRPKSERLTLQFRYGPLRGLVADAYADGSLRLRSCAHDSVSLEDMDRLAHAGLGRQGVVGTVREMEGGRLEQGKPTCSVTIETLNLPSSVVKGAGTQVGSDASPSDEEEQNLNFERKELAFSAFPTTIPTPLMRWLERFVIFL